MDTKKNSGIEQKSLFRSIYGDKLCFIVCVLGLFGFQQVYANTYYVSPTGANTNKGTSLTTPVKTLAQGLSLAKKSGDIIYVTTGTYVETININQSGVTLSAYPGNFPVIDGQTVLPSADWGALITIWGNNNTVSGFEVKNSNINGSHLGGYGIQVVGNSNTINQVNAHNTWQQAIMVNGDYNTVENSTVWQAALQNATNNGTVTSGWGSGLSAGRNASTTALIPGIASYATLKGNTVYNTWGEGLSCYDADHCTIEDNIVYDNWTTNLYLSNATNSLVQRNLVYASSSPAIPTRNNAPTPGIMLADEETILLSANNVVVNNFIYNSNFDAFAWTGINNSGLHNVLIAYNTIVGGSFNTGSGGSPTIVNTNSSIENNIIFTSQANVPSNSGITFANNNWSVVPPAAASATNVTGNPLITQTGTTLPGALSSTFFLISSKSPLLATGKTISSVTTDFFQVTRNSTKPDIGGYELQSAGITPPAVPTKLAAKASATAVNLTWSASTGSVSATGYIIYRNGIQIGTSTGTSFIDTSVTIGSTYSYSVAASAGKANISAASSLSTVKIP
jgi:hypothetical protein